MKFNQGANAGVKKIPQRRKEIFETTKLCVLCVGKELLLPEIKRNGYIGLVI